MKFVLLILFYGYKTGAAMETIEFSTLAACKTAQTEVVAMLNKSGRSYTTQCLAMD